MRLLCLLFVCVVLAGCEAMPDGPGERVKGEWVCWEKGYGWVCYPASFITPDGKHEATVTKASSACKATVAR